MQAWYKPPPHQAQLRHDLLHETWYPALCTVHCSFQTLICNLCGCPVMSTGNGSSLKEIGSILSLISLTMMLYQGFIKECHLEIAFWDTTFYSKAKIERTRVVHTRICWLPACSIVSDSQWPPWTWARQAPLSTGFFRQENWSRLPFPSPGTFASCVSCIGR